VAYEDTARALVRAWKERGVRRVVDLAADLVVAQLERPAADVITYIPPDPARQLTRTGHPAVGLAAALGDAWNLELEPLLARTRPSHRQTGSRRLDRLRNVRGAFESRVSEERRRIVLVDDVYTTGATADAAARALRGAGAASIHVVSFARTVR
jgi:predicted amidophosphoribosyltransferase